LTAERIGIGPEPGSRTTSLASPRMMIVHGATTARRSRGIAASRDRTTTGAARPPQPHRTAAGVVIEPTTASPVAHRETATQRRAPPHRIDASPALPPARELLQRRKNNGDGGMEALRILKRRLSDVVYRAMITDQQNPEKVTA
jgi:hypothetical protein